MKKIFSSLLFVVVLTTSYGQVQPDTSAHLTFKGIPIDGTLNEFVLKMKKSGFTYQGTKNGIATFYGDFASYTNCMIGTSTPISKDLVSKVVVLFPDCDTWSLLSGNYYYLKDMLTSKYGKPWDCVEKFDREPRDDKDRMYEVKLDRCKYLTSYETGKGTIQLTIAHNDVNSCFVTLAYFDKINGEIVKQQAQDEL
ncbi:hypothetical protein [Paraflavitalea pollutisoli]|uniref:hypothetical protein n=1 Tax=Paraflavitalea pollutisoli TaxID=3034143 RepID=UPI0023ED8519|nr:hypothetical protein [Paraflavitalea sp. H1-2-19X]